MSTEFDIVPILLPEPLAVLLVELAGELPVALLVGDLVIPAQPPGQSTRPAELQQRRQQSAMKEPIEHLVFQYLADGRQTLPT